MALGARLEIGGGGVWKIHFLNLRSIITKICLGFHPHPPEEKNEWVSRIICAYEFLGTKMKYFKVVTHVSNVAQGPTV